MKQTPRGIRNNNPLNIRKGNNWLGERHPQMDAAFEEFESMEYGIRAGFKILRNYISGYGGLTHKVNTIEKIVRRWAPESENDTLAYINKVAKDTGIHPNEIVSFSDRNKMVAIVDAMISVECGQHIDIAVIQSAYDMVV